MIQNVLVLGAGSAGLIAAISLKRQLPELGVRIVRSPEIGVIGVGEGTTPNFPRHLFQNLGISRKQFYAHAQPTWKLGIRFLWGPRGRFDYGFWRQLDARQPELSRANGFYCDDDFQGVDLPSALMAHDKVFTRQANGAPDVQGWHAFHVENKKLVSFLEAAARGAGIEILDGKVERAELRPQGGVQAVLLEDGRRLEADLFIDASGFRSELLGKALEEPFVSYDRSLFCDRAVVGGWERTDEPILPYTTAETMDAGWSWQIEHEHHVNRGYVFSSQFLSDDEAREEFRRKNPKVPADGRVIKFRSGHYRRSWVDNVVAMGNASGFVEPLEATALMVVCAECQTLTDLLQHSGLDPSPSMVNLYNDTLTDTWDEIRDFLALHYKVNTALDTPFWRHCREDTDVSGIAKFLAFYAENGPVGFNRHLLRHEVNNFTLDGWLVMMVGNHVPYARRYHPPQNERRIWERHRQNLAAQAQKALGVKEALAYVRHPEWRWAGE